MTLETNKNKSNLKKIVLAGIILIAITTTPIAFSQQFETAVQLTEPIPENGASFGISTATGDINGDGEDDIIVGARFANPGGVNDAGEAFVFLGPDFTSVITLTEPILEAGAQFGVSVATGDINNDNIDDVIVGARSADPGGISRAGEAFVFLGPSLTTVISLTEPVPQASALFGHRVESGDLNNDNFDDVIVNARDASPGGNFRAGETFVFFGPSLTTVTTLTEPTIEPDARFGISIATGDINNDNIDDLILGASNANPGGNFRAGEAFVFFGPSLTSFITLAEPTPESQAFFGSAVESADIDGDGIDDVVVAAQFGVVSGLNDAGEVFVFFGPSLTTVTTITEPIPEGGAFFGGSSMAVGDINNDGKSDIIAGSRLGNVGNAGEVFIFLGPDLTNIVTITEPTPEANANFGTSMATGDINNDGLDDVIVGAQLADVGSNIDAGEVFYFQSIPEIVELSLEAEKDSFLRQGTPNRNEGINEIMQLRANGNNRALVEFNQTSIEDTAGSLSVINATLRLYIEDNFNGWGASGRTIDAHTVSENWAEGNAANLGGNIPGTGDGVTWKCAVDTDISDQNKDCATEWSGGNFDATPTDTITITNGLEGVYVEFDVTADVQDFLDGTVENNGWIIKKTLEGQAGKLQFTSSEGVTNHPELVIFFG